MKQTINIIAFLVFSGFITYLYLQNKEEWEMKYINSSNKLDSLETLSVNLSEQLAKMEEDAFERNRAIYEYRFDPFDSDNFRIYGLFRDVEKRYSVLDVALKFNITNSKAIKWNDVMGERWFIVPVKGMHYLTEEDTYTNMAARYYEEPADSVLIPQFNLDPSPGKFVFVPFGK
ncbi:MAG: hypothetical protein KTR26_14310 [Flammeovirgaceae bacterium]|nr:hypothetical protein [Flammeovirgaceae bacterium]